MDSGSSVLFFLAYSPLTNCARNGEKLIPNTTLMNCNAFGFSFWFFIFYFCILWNGQSILRIPILICICATSHTRAIWYLNMYIDQILLKLWSWMDDIIYGFPFIFRSVITQYPYFSCQFVRANIHKVQKKPSIICFFLSIYIF